MATRLGARNVVDPIVKQIRDSIRPISGVTGTGNNNGGAGTGSGVTRNSTGSGGRKQSASGTGTVSGYGSTINAADLYNAQIANQQAAANEAYNNTMARIAGAYDSIKGNIQGNYDSSVGRLNAARKKSLNQVNVDAEDSLRQAYINNELTKRGLNQRLSAMGYNGGAVESTMANLANEYANSRTDINKTLNRNIGDLEQTYGDNLAAALQAYNSAMTNLDMQRLQLENAAETARANMQTQAPDLASLLTMDQGYITALQNALANQNGFQYTASQATNDYIPGNAQQANAAADTTAYAKALQQAQLQASQGANGQQILNNLYGQVQSGALDIMTLAQIRQQLGI